MDLLDNEIQEVDEKNYLEKILTSPRKAFRFLQEYQYDRYTYTIIFLASIISALDNAFENNRGDETSLVVVIIIAVLVGGLAGWIGYAVSSWLLYYGGRFLDEEAKGSREDLLRVLSHASIPTIFLAPFFVFFAAVYGRDFYATDNIVINNFELFFYYFYWIVYAILTMWSLVLTVIGVSETQGFSIGKAIVNIFLPGLILACILLAIVFLFTIVGTAF